MIYGVRLINQATPYRERRLQGPRDLNKGEQTMSRDKT
jgi:hypothetical protein